MKVRDQQKINEAILYVAQRIKNMYNILKVLYFADKDHLEKYGRFIINDDHSVLPFGPVPSFAYDLIKEWRGEGEYQPISIDQSFEVKRNLVRPSREPNMDFLSPTDIECLDRAVDTYGALPWRELQKISHEDPAYIEAKERGDKNIDIRTIAKHLKNGSKILEYIEQKCQ